MRNKKYILTMDIGGTTFTSGIFDNNLNLIYISPESYIQDYKSKSELILGFESQIVSLCNKYNVLLENVIGLSIAAPGPLNSKNGMILNTPNLIILKNTNIVSIMENKLGLSVKLENDANLFALGEWYLYFQKYNFVTALTLGSGLGVGLIVNRQLFKGAHGMGAEYGISPYESGLWEDEISIEGVEKQSLKYFDNTLSPKELYDLATQGDLKALKIWNDFGKKFGLFISHIVNLLDPNIVTIGGGLSGSFIYFNQSMKSSIKKYAPSYEYNSIKICVSENQLNSTHYGAALILKTYKLS